MSGHRNRYDLRRCGLALVLTALVLLGGCGRTGESKTILLPQEAQEAQNGISGAQESDYTVHKIYTQLYEAGAYHGYTAFLPDSGEHRVHLLKRGDDGESEEISMDYRYGFHEQRYIITEQMLVYLELWQDNGRRYGSSIFNGEISPDGRYILFVDNEHTYTGSRLYLLDLETGEEQLLLDGDIMGCPGDQFQMITAWDAEGGVLCYGFCPADAEVWKDQAETGKFVLHFLDLETKVELQLLDYSSMSIEGLASDFFEMRLYVDRDEDRLLTAVVNGAGSGEGSCINLFSQKIPETDLELLPEEVLPETLWYDKEITDLWLDAGQNQCYSSYLDGANGGIVRWGVLEEGHKDLYLGGAIKDFLVLDEGETIITAEAVDGQAEQEICLYTGNETGFTRSLLYKGTGNFVRLQYDSEHRRLMAEFGDLMTVNGSPFGATRGIVVLEFE